MAYMSLPGTKPEYERVCFDGGDRGSSRPRLNIGQATHLTHSGPRL